jgi:hypothetical protein
MKQLKLVLLLFLTITKGYSQVKVDTLRTERKGLKTYTIQGTAYLTQDSTLKLYKNTKKAEHKYKKGKTLITLSPFLVIGGAYLAYDAIKGKPMQATVSGKTYDYTERSLSKLLIGLASVVTGGAFFEGGNEMKANAAKEYNKTLQPKTAYHWKIGITPTGNVGFALNF